ncbi:hypothetical protein OG474_30235 [Kribbella sp. NBC_01505]|uniref:hypothetical protein n=1 Tax=Kribbella sp. NBC_01505 TaxID=2903580 RepID=UPI003866B69C
MFAAEDIKRLERFTRSFRAQKPNCQIVKSLKDEAGEPVHLDVDELEGLVRLARTQLPLREMMKLHEIQLWHFDPVQERVIRTRPESRIEAGL